MARGLDEEFLHDLKEGILAPLLEAIVRDRDLLLEIRENYINVYFYLGFGLWRSRRAELD